MLLRNEDGRVAYLFSGEQTEMRQLQLIKL
jgi:hypothetical protein